MNNTATTIDEYLADVPTADREMLQGLRQTIRAAAPEAVELISYGMPTFKYRGKRLIYFAAAKNHCALYGTSQGTIRFTSKEPLAESLVETLVRERIAAIEASASTPKRKTPSKPSTG